MNLERLKIDTQEILRYLGYRGQEIPDNLLTLIEESVEEVKKTISPKYTYSYYPIIIKNNKVIVENTNIILQGNSILNHLKHCEGCIFIAATLGNAIERLTRLYEKKDLTKSLIIDACATTAIEEVCDNLEESINKAMNTSNKYATYRYSPGYGDFNISIQKKFLKVLNCEKNIGLTCSDHNILMPRKSVTAIIGISSLSNIKNQSKFNKCYRCSNYKNCNYKKEGFNCEIKDI